MKVSIKTLLNSNLASIYLRQTKPPIHTNVHGLRHTRYLRHTLSLSALTLSLAACAPIPQSNVTPVVAEPSVPLHLGYDGRPVPEDQSTSIAAQRWQDYYQDPKLQALIAIGLDNNKDIEQTLLAIRRAEAQYQITDNKDLPTLNANGSYSRAANNAVDRNPSDSFSVNLGMANYELDFWGRVASLKEQALHNFLATAAARDTAKVSLIANIAKSYVALSYQMMQLELASKTLESRIESLRITQARLQAGIDPKTPSLRAAVAADDAYIAKLEAERSVKKGINTLEYLIGAPIPEALLPTPAVNNITDKEAINAGLPSELLRYRPDILQAEYELKAAGANIEVARAAYYPSISLTGRLGYSSNELGDLFDTNLAGWSFGPSINVPIFDAGQLDANYEMAQIDQERALLNYERAIETAFREVNDVLADKQALDARLAAEYRLQENYKQIVEIAEARYQAQVDDYLSVLDAQRSQFATQQRIVNLEQERVMNQIEMYKVLGGGANLGKPIPIPLSQHNNLVNILTPKSNDQRATHAIKAASSPALISPKQAAIIKASKPTVKLQSKVIDTADTNADSKPDVIIAQITEVIEEPLISVNTVDNNTVDNNTVDNNVVDNNVVDNNVVDNNVVDNNNVPVEPHSSNTDQSSAPISDTQANTADADATVVAPYVASTQPAVINPDVINPIDTQIPLATTPKSMTYAKESTVQAQETTTDTLNDAPIATIELETIDSNTIADKAIAIEPSTTLEPSTTSETSADADMDTIDTGVADAMLTDK